MYNAKQVAWTAGIALVVILAYNHYTAKAGSGGSVRSVTRLAG